ncbi:hypothetical protein JVU11DRAFT_612 [Chiua virens]|nr:hypothetical protein JVU11DRAFT_612 [Chiua virens]
MPDHEHESDSPVSQFSFDDDEIVWSHGSLSDTDFIVLHHPLFDAHSIPSNLSDSTGHTGTDGDLSSALDKLSLCDPKSLVDTPSSTSSESDSDCVLSKKRTRADKRRRRRAARKSKREAKSSDVSPASSEYHSGASTPTASYDNAAAFISRLDFGPQTLPDLPSTLTSARKLLKAEVHVNIKEYVATRHKGQSALTAILKPSKSALRKDIRKGNKASLQWVKQQGLQVLLVTCFR